MTKIYTAGTWEMFHFGHLNILLEAKKRGDYLIVGCSTDELIEKYKGMKPIISYDDRVAILEELKCVDKVIKQSSFFDIDQLKKYNINSVILGNDWEGKSFPELENFLDKTNTKIIYIPYTKRLSTSKIKKQIIENSYDIIKSSFQR